MGKYSPIIDPFKRVDPSIIRQLEAASSKLLDARDNIISEGLPTERMEFLIRQAKHTIKSVERLCQFE